jgi:hypothetical protein
MQTVSIQNLTSHLRAGQTAHSSDLGVLIEFTLDHRLGDKTQNQRGKQEAQKSRVVIKHYHNLLIRPDNQP